MNKKKTILIIQLFLLFLINFSVAQNNLYITYSPDDCIGCNKHLDYIKLLKQPYKKVLVFPEDVRDDSNAIIQKYSLDQYGLKFIFSDSLFQKITGGKRNSMISLQLDDNIHAITILLKQFDTNYVKLFDRLNESEFSVSLNKYRSNLVYNKATNIYVKSPYKGTIDVYDIVSNTLTHKIMLSDSVSRRAYNIFLGRDEYDRQIQRMEEIKVPESSNIQDFFMVRDTLFVVSEFNYVADLNQSEQKTVVNAFYAISTILNNKCIDVGVTQMYTKDTSYFIRPEMTRLGFSFIAAVAENNKGGWNKKKHFSLLKKKGSHYEMDSILPIILNNKFYVSDNYTNPLFDRKNYMMPLEAKVRDLKTGEIVVDLKLFDNIDNVCKSVAHPAKRFVYTFKYSEKENTVWVLYCNNETNIIHYLKYDSKKGEIIEDKEIGSYFNINSIGISDYNYNNIFYSTKGKVTFKRIFE